MVRGSLCFGESKKSGHSEIDCGEAYVCRGAGGRLYPHDDVGVGAAAVVGDPAEGGASRDGELLTNGTPNPRHAFCERLADLADAFAQDDLGVMQRTTAKACSRITPRPRSGIVSLRTKATLEGRQTSASCNAIRHGAPRTMPKARSGSASAAEQGDAVAQYNLGHHETVRTRGVRRTMCKNTYGSALQRLGKDIAMKPARCRDSSASKLTPCTPLEVRKLTHEWKPKYVACAASPRALGQVGCRVPSASPPVSGAPAPM